MEIDLEVKAPGTEKVLNDFQKLKLSLKEATGELAGLTAGTDKYIEQAKKVGAIKDEINDLKDSIKNVSGAPIENLTNSFGMLGGQVRSLDFGGANNSLKQFGTGLKNIKPKELIGEFKQFAQTMGGIGKALLTNPLFLIPALIVGIGAALYALKDKVKFIGDAFEYVGKIIGVVVQGFKDLTDWIGITNNATEDLAEKNIESAKKTQTAVTERYDFEIQKAKAAGKSTLELEKQKSQAVRDAIKEQILALSTLFVANGKFNDEQTKQLEELKKQYKDTLKSDVIATETANKEKLDKQKEYNKQVADANKALQKQIEDNNLAAMADQDAKAQAKLDLDYQRGLKEIENSKAIETLKNEAKLALRAQYDQAVADLEKKKTDAAFAELVAQQDKDAKEAEAKKAQDQADFEAALEEGTKQEEKRTKILSDEKEKRKALDAEEQANRVLLANSTLTSIQSLSDAIFSIQEANKKKGSKSAEEDAKKQFKINKALQLAGAAINGAQAITTSLAAAPPVIGIAPNPAGIAALVSIGLTTAATIAKISAMQFQPSGGGTPSAGGSTFSAPASGPASTNSATGPQPGSTFNPNAGAFNPNTINNVNGGQQPAVVSVVEIANKMNKVNTIEQRATF